jgi:hypothetical protein
VCAQVERRRAERSRAAQLNMLSAEDRQLQLAKELKTAMDSAKQVQLCFSFVPFQCAHFVPDLVSCAEMNQALQSAVLQNCGVGAR